ncbi:MAG: ferric reductase-like transmembrane domain-containing protein [Hyphomicrobiaceae bacterium]
MKAIGVISARAALTWAALAVAVAVPLAAAAVSPLHQWRGPVYIAAGFAGVVGLALMLVQPLLIGGYLPGLSAYRGRRVHRWIGGLLVLAVIVHVVGLWVTSPPDVIDALLFDSPTPFSNWGVVAMWAIFATALLALVRRRARLGLRTWRVAHTAFAVVIVITTAAHAMLIEGAMETVSKAILCALVILATLKVVADLRVWTTRSNAR